MLHDLSGLERSRGRQSGQLHWVERYSQGRAPFSEKDVDIEHHRTVSALLSDVLVMARHALQQSSRIRSTLSNDPGTTVARAVLRATQRGRRIGYTP